LALPRGGVPVVYELAIALSAPHDVFIVCKLGLPCHEELLWGDTIYCKEPLMRQLDESICQETIMKIGEFCNRDVIIMNRDESVKTAAELMRRHHVGDVVLVEENEGQRVPIGIVTDRDLVVEVMAVGLETTVLTVQDIVTRSLLMAKEEDSVFDCLEFMKIKGVRRLPVVDEDKSLIGIITMDDITAILAGMLYNVVSLVDRQQRNEIKQRP
jgi:CBS domain-containing protein